MSGFKMRWLGLGVVLVISANAHASRFANQFVEFEYPPQWNCNLEGAEWVCQSSDAAKKKDAIVILAAKLRGDQDSLDQYLTHLKQAKTYQGLNGKSVKSEPKYAKTININDHAWVDSLHLESELPGFYTRYIATVKKDIGVLVTFSVNKAKYQNYLQDMDNLVKTLKVFRKSGGLNVKQADTNLFDSSKIPDTVSQGTVFPSVDIEGASDKPEKPKKEGGMSNLLLILGGAILVIILLRRRKKQD